MRNVTWSSGIRRAIATGFCAAAIVATGAAWAAEPPAESAAAAPVASDATATTGPIVTWHSAHGRFETPTPEAARALVAEMQAALAASPTIAARLGNDAKPKVEVLPNGMARMRMPARQINFAVVRPTGASLEIAACTQGPVAASGVVTNPLTATAQPVER